MKGDVDVNGRVITVSGGVEQVEARGGAGGDTFLITPSPDVSFAIAGELPALPANPGDWLRVAPDTGAAGAALVLSALDSGTVSFDNRLTIGFTGIESVPPAVLNAAFAFETAQRVTLAFSRDVGATLDAQDVELTNLTPGLPVPPGQIDLVYDAPTMEARLTFTNVPGGVLPDGNYRLRLPAAAVADPLGEPLIADGALDFFVFTGDADRDRTINIGDFSILAANFNAPGTFSRGDFNYNGQVEIGDFAILAGKFNATLPTPASGPRGAFASTRVIDGLFV